MRWVLSGQKAKNRRVPEASAGLRHSDAGLWRPDLCPAQNERFSYLKIPLTSLFSVENLGSPKYNVGSKNEQKS